MLKIFYLEDHLIYAKSVKDIIEEVLQDAGIDYKIFYASDYRTAQKLISVYGEFTHSLIDVMLQNGKNGLELYEKNKSLLLNPLFITGNIDNATIDTLESRNYKHINKISDDVADTLETFLLEKVIS